MAVLTGGKKRPKVFPATVVATVTPVPTVFTVVDEINLTAGTVPRKGSWLEILTVHSVAEHHDRRTLFC
jgi:hypothetical protein